ncbi:MAG: NAD(P)/FAD-dependent oxidoreductase [Myxococcota bacterium]
MRFHRESRDDRYDVVVIGAGLGGLAAAARLAKAGRKVLVVERHDRPGGYAHAFKRKRYQFDSAVHLMSGGGTGPVAALLGELGVADRVDLVRVDPFYAAVFPGLRIDAPLGVEPFLDAHARAFPGERAGIAGFLRDCLAIREETERVEELGRLDAVLTHARSLPTLRRYHRSTLARVLDAHVGDAHAKAALGALWPYLGLPPSRLSFHYFAMMLAAYLEQGAWYCRGSFQRLADALAFAIVRDGGEVLLKSSVRRVCVDGGRVAGVVLENGQRIDAPVVVSNADARQTFEEMVGLEHLPEGAGKELAAFEPSLSAFVVYGATTLDLAAAGAAHEMFLYRTWSHDEDHANALRGRPSRIGFTVPTLADGVLAPEGEHLFAITVLLPMSLERSWRAAKERYEDELLRQAERAFPGLRASLRFVESATPRTFERYTRNTDGAMYGWAARPEQVGHGRLAARGAVAGLHLAGHWTQPGPGVQGAVASGVAAARTVLGDDVR